MSNNIMTNLQPHKAQNGHTHGELHITPLIINPPTMIIKRDGRIVPFEVERIEQAITRCFASFGRIPNTPISQLAKQACNIVAAQYTQPTVEQVQDIVEMVLQAAGEYEGAKRYILYRAEHAKMRQQRPVPETVRHLFEESSHYFPTHLQQFQFYDKYSRFNYESGRRETWIETVDRAVNYLTELSQGRLPGETYQRVRQAILEMKAMPSMRLLAMAGTAARRNNITIYNCSYMPVESIDSFVEGLIISMSGCGVGFSVEQRYVENFPRIKRQSHTRPLYHTVEDSAEGWAEAVRLGLETWFDGGDIQFDFSFVRPAGKPLRTKGGRASGPDPLHKMLQFARARILARQGSFLRSIDAHDIMCAIGNAAVSGGMRRTAMISLFDYDDLDMRHCKDGDFERHNSQRWNANNSAVWPNKKLSQEEVARFFLDMVDSQRGEPGIFNRQAAILTKPERRAVAEFGTNPCITGDSWIMTQQGPRQVYDLVGQPHLTMVNGQPFATTAAGFWLSGYKPIFRVQTKEGYTLRATSDHPLRVVTYHSRKIEKTAWCPISELKPGDLVKIHNQRDLVSWSGHGSYQEGWLLGSLVGDGTFTKQQEPHLKTAILAYWGEHRQTMATQALTYLHDTVRVRADNVGFNHLVAEKTVVQSSGLARLAEQYGLEPHQKTVTDLMEMSSSEFHQGFLQGLFDADGTVTGQLDKGLSVRLSQSNLETLQKTQRMLLRLGIASTLYQNRKAAGYKLLPDGRGGMAEYWCQANHELVISEDNLGVFADRVGFSDPAKQQKLQNLLASYKRQPNRERFMVTIESVTLEGEEAVYDCSVPGPNAFDANGFYVKNCGEIILRPWQFCNLSIAVARQDDSYETLREKVEVATLIGTIQSMATYFPGLRSMWQQNCEEERLLGVDVTGQLDSLAAQDPEIQAKLRQVALDTNRMAANVLGINTSAAITCVKPSGNSSQLLNCSPGIHARWSKYYIRNVRVSTHTPIFKVLRDIGVPMDPENGQLPETADTWVIHFPVKSPDGAITRNERSALEQCEYWLQNKLHWTEHNPSVTITYKPDEIIDLIKWVWQYQDKIGGMAFLPAFDAQYDQMPYVEIGAEEYQRLAAKFPEIDFSKLYRYEEEDYTTAAQELACLAGVCEVTF